ncbi:MAG TPA: hypothetical protein VGJ41_16135 [Nocardioides sp.]
MLTATRVGLVAAALVGTTLPLIVAASPAEAATCISEASGNPLAPFACDDADAPNTSITATPVRNGWITTSSATFAFSGAYDDSDTGALALECRFNGQGIASTTTWSTCESPKTYSGLQDTTSGYTFEVRAYDATDRAVHPDPVLDFGKTDTNPDEEDATPAKVVFKVDTTVPTGYLIGGPYDELTPANPVLWSRATSYTLGASESPADFACRLSSIAVACGDGTKRLTGLTSGNKTFTLRVSDPAGNTDPHLRSKRFTVPWNGIGSAAERTRWKRVTSRGYFDGDYLETRIKGATLSRPNTTLTELRLRIPKAPGLGSFRVKIGDTYFKPVYEASSTTSTHNIVVVRGPNTVRMTGTLRIIALTSKPVRIDAIMFR